MFQVLECLPVLNKQIAQFYFASLLLCLEHLHNNSIVHRDIKPENSMIDASGRVYLVDMGTAKILEKLNGYRTFTIIGTSHYMAPEVYEGKGYSFEADIWSLGIVLYQILFDEFPFGYNTFKNADPYEIFQIIKHSDIKFPEAQADPQAVHALTTILHKNPQQRAITASIEQIKALDYFKDIDWDAIATAKAPPPITLDIPTLANTVDTIKGTSVQSLFAPKKHSSLKTQLISEWNDNF